MFIVTAGGDEIHARSVLAATGIKYAQLNVPGMNLKGVLVGAAAVEAPKHRDEDIFIVGGGNSAGQAAVHFAHYARKVSLVVRDCALSSFMSAYMVDKLEHTANIEIIYCSTVEEIMGDGHVQQLRIKNTRDGKVTTVPAAALIIHIGGKPSSQWGQGLGILLDPLGYVVTGTDIGAGWPDASRAPLFLETCVPGCFVAGDVRHNATKRCATAVGDGAMAVALIHQYLMKYTRRP
jgi:thioredoxin reductase (NADPH)